eukprot:GFKZ01013780.1.p1 GENE.GFKZ01013780.1~~GFKZ01013780.1.p1  ORF type:complete len:288 (-),score=23.69 GFKZ01013780.1:2222-3085(-)
MSDFIPSCGKTIERGTASQTHNNDNTSVDENVHSPPKRPRVPSDATDATPSVNEEPSQNNAAQRVAIRIMTYFVYDRFSVAGGYKELARIGKAFVELIVDECFPPPHRAAMSLGRKCTEYLLAPAASSLIWFLSTQLRSVQRPKAVTFRSSKSRSVTCKAIWTVLHRTARQALIYRLFFRIGSIRYSLASALGIICCFFKETIFRELVWITRWPKHFSTLQGVSAILRSLIYALAFSLPLHRVSKRLRESPRRRGNIKKIVFALALSQSERLMGIGKRIFALYAGAI